MQDTKEIVPNFQVVLESFQGPLDLLLDLIEKRKLHISTVSLSKVADDFIEYVKKIEEFPIAHSSDFILIASTLLLIKSKSLLPTLEVTTEEQNDISDLEHRLAEYKKYKDLSKGIEKMFGNFLFFGMENKQKVVVFNPSNDTTKENLQKAINEILGNIQRKENIPKVMVQKVISLEDMIESLSERIKTGIRTSFKEFSQIGKMEKVNVIVSFLAMLELVKQGIVRVNQEKHFDDIEIEGENIGIPTY